MLFTKFIWFIDNKVKTPKIRPSKIKMPVPDQLGMSPLKIKSKIILILIVFFHSAVIAQEHNTAGQENYDGAVVAHEPKVENLDIYRLSGESDDDFATGTQFNNNYFVTAGHVDFFKESGFKCKDIGCDLKFIENYQENHSQWRNPKPIEKVRLVGSGKGGEIRTVEGTTLPAFHYMGDSPIAYQLIKADISKGMSGGPVYGEDGKIVGMIIGYFDESSMDKYEALKGLGRIGVFLPADEINRQWLKLRIEQDEP